MKRNLKLAAAFIAAALMTFASCNKKAEAQDTSSVESKTENDSENAKPNPESDFEIKISDDVTWVKVTKYVGVSEKIVVPETIQGLPVLSVSIGAPKATLVVIPSTAKIIWLNVGGKLEEGKYADVVLPEGLIAISGLRGRISSVKLPSTVKYIGEKACNGYLYTKELVLPSSLEYVGDEGLFSFDSIGIENLTFSAPVGKLFIIGNVKCQNIPNLPENFETSFRYGFSYDSLRFGSGDKQKEVGEVFRGPWQDKVNSSVELKKKFDLKRKIPGATKEEGDEFFKNLSATLEPLPKEIRTDIKNCINFNMLN